MRELHPTLWRTCRVLAGNTRLRLLRQLQDAPGHDVSSLAEIVGIGVSDASQELRRLQSRGLLQTDRKGARLIYRIGADPQVPSAAPLLKALLKAFASRPPDQDPAMMPIATGLAHPRRIAIAKTLMDSPAGILSLRIATRMPPAPMSRHLGILKAGGWVQADKRTLSFRPSAHPLALALARLLHAE